ncbi:MAG: cellulose biosynthesis protein CelD, partial [Paraglaciecola sp.]|nr:cellulose biosynthesis protein CelD [Paraglaciecola sp.]
MTANTSQPLEFSAKHYLLKDRVALARQWQQLEQDAEASFFLSWQWIGTWVAVYPLDLIVLEVLNSEQRLVGLALLHQRDIKRHSLISSKALYLQQSGLASLDQIWIEYNGLLVNRQYQQQITATALAYIAHELKWDEFMLGGINRDTAEVYASQLALNSHQLWQA